MKTFSAKPAEVKRDWYVVDADGKTLGRLSTEIARRLRGKHKAEYTPHVDTGDYIIVINAEKVRVTGNKEQDKIYYKHTGFIGNMKSVALGKLRQTYPERIIETAVKGMLPKNPLGRAMFKKLKVYAGGEHGHQAQQPKLDDDDGAVFAGDEEDRHPAEPPSGLRPAQRDRERQPAGGRHRVLTGSCCANPSANRCSASTFALSG